MKIGKRNISSLEELGRNQFLFSGALAGLFAALTFYLIVHVLFGIEETLWAFIGLAALAGIGVGLFFGARSAAAGIGAGILGGIWIFFEIIAAVIMVFVELIGAVIVAIFSIFN